MKLTKLMPCRIEVQGLTVERPSPSPHLAGARSEAFRVHTGSTGPSDQAAESLPGTGLRPGRASTQLGPAPLLRLPGAVSGHGSQAEDTRAGQRRAPEPALPLPASQASLDWIGVPTAPPLNIQLHF